MHNPMYLTDKYSFLPEHERQKKFSLFTTKK